MPRVPRPHHLRGLRRSRALFGLHHLHSPWLALLLVVVVIAVVVFVVRRPRR